MNAAQHDQAPAAEVEEYDIDKGFLMSIFKGYAGGIIVIAAVMALIAHHADKHMSMPVVIGVSFAVAFWIGIMGGVVAVGLWSQRHEHELFH